MEIKSDLSTVAVYRINMRILFVTFINLFIIQMKPFSAKYQNN